MSWINIKGIIRGIRSKTNVYTPIIEAVVNSIDAITAADNNSEGHIEIILKRSKQTALDDSLPAIEAIEVLDNGIGFTRECRDSFDTYLSEAKLDIGGKGFGRFMFAKYFDRVRIESTYYDDDTMHRRKFAFGRDHEIIIEETDEILPEPAQRQTRLRLLGLRDDKNFDKELKTVAKKIAEKILPFMVNDAFVCPRIVVREEGSNQQIVLNEYVLGKKEIVQIGSRHFTLKGSLDDVSYDFTAKVFKIFYPGSGTSKVSLTGNNREVVETALANYVPEFQDEFFEEMTRTNRKTTRRNYIIKAYVFGDYLDRSVDLEREGFLFDKEKANAYYSMPQNSIEAEAASIAREIMGDEIISRSENKKRRIIDFVQSTAPWHTPILKNIDYSRIPFNFKEENIEAELQRQKFTQEQEVKKDIRKIIADDEAPNDEKLAGLLAKITDLGKTDLAHYVANRKVVIDTFNNYRKRRRDGKAEEEKELHQLIYPMGMDSSTTGYETHNLWLLDERLVFSQFIASDQKIGTARDALKEPDLVIFNRLRSYRAGENEFSNPLTIYEFKRPKRTDYDSKEDPIIQIGKYVELIRGGKYETPKGIEPVKANEFTPVYAYVVSDLTPKMHEFAKNSSLTLSPDCEGYFGYHTGYKMYIEVISFKKLIEDADKRNRIFFKMLGIV